MRAVNSNYLIRKEMLLPVRSYRGHLDHSLVLFTSLDAINYVEINTK